MIWNKGHNDDDDDVAMGKYDLYLWCSGAAYPTLYRYPQWARGECNRANEGLPMVGKRM